MAVIILTQTGSAMTHSQQQWCSDVSVEAGTSGSSEMDEGGTAGSATGSVLQSNGDPEERGIYFESTAIGETTWAAPDGTNPYRVRLNVTTADEMNWTGCWICQLNASGVSQGVLADDSDSADFPINMNSTGTKTATFTTGHAGSSPGTDHRIGIVCLFTENVAHGNTSITVTFDQDIDTPIVSTATGSGSISMAGDGGLAGSGGLAGRSGGLAG